MMQDKDTEQKNVPPQGAQDHSATYVQDPFDRPDADWRTATEHLKLKVNDLTVRMAQLEATLKTMSPTTGETMDEVQKRQEQMRQEGVRAQREVVTKEQQQAVIQEELEKPGDKGTLKRPQSGIIK